MISPRLGPPGLVLTSNRTPAWAVWLAASQRQSEFVRIVRLVNRIDCDREWLVPL